MALTKLEQNDETGFLIGHAKKMKQESFEKGDWVK